MTVVVESCLINKEICHHKSEEREDNVNPAIAGRLRKTDILLKELPEQSQDKGADKGLKSRP
jgi:hypothetical protein